MISSDGWPADDASTPVHVGTSGWSYAHWEHVLYPPGLPPADRLGRYVEAFGTAELNASFYRWPKERTFAGWRRRLPPGFLLSVKAPRGLTHAKRLYAPEVWVERLVSCWHQLADRRGVLLVQLPPTLARDDARLEYFLESAPGVDARGGRVPTSELAGRPGVRDPEPLRRRVRGDERGADCRASSRRPPRSSTCGCTVRTTTTSTAARYSDADLGWWADRIRDWQRLGHSVFVYFNNDGGGNAVRNAWTLRGLVGA